MMNHRTPLAAPLAVVWLCGAPSARVPAYYVDFTGGRDDGDRLSMQAAWRRCPGDASAEGRAKAAALQPSEAVLFKGGVTYHGGIVMSAHCCTQRSSGTPAPERGPSQ